MSERMIYYPFFTDNKEIMGNGLARSYIRGGGGMCSDDGSGHSRESESCIAVYRKFEKI